MKYSAKCINILLCFVLDSISMGHSSHIYRLESSPYISFVTNHSFTSVSLLLSNETGFGELVQRFEASLSLSDILPKPARQYDKNRAPKLLGQPTVVYFHVTVLSLDSINEESMVLFIQLVFALTIIWIRILDLCNWYISGSNLAWPTLTVTRKYEWRI